ncbi:MAG: hypothetical protein A3J37_07730 [Alphaproteobacteria bacterium RIFCSPHIGHO2_12_FULL_45_9]|nr:MAG: hypothetical protein A3B66_02870 [Alphaproteobacteria bacterium RIFCSPHIGHO2_02_FULL_46_13]OFW93983.1 MAG: hypothetical protein A3J37_07730 [Alphaproteobacteria bacterium RIFCSPHIGHO2_12_FULL_45_9]
MDNKRESAGFDYHAESGLTLIEVCILLIIFSLLLIPALQVMSLERKSKEISAHNGTTIDLANALTNYALENGAYPVPAGPRLAINDPKVFMPAGYPEVLPAMSPEIPSACAISGAEGQTAGANNGVICRPRFNWASWNDYSFPSSVNAQVYVGALPVSVLGLPPEKGLDEYGHKFTYIVTRILTNRATFSDSGGVITIADPSNSTKYSNAHFAIVSHGRNGFGGWTPNGTLLGPSLTLNPCPGSSVGAPGIPRAEFGNQYQCKYHASGGGHIGYVRALFKTASTIQERSTFEGTGDSFYDDSVAFKTSVFGRLWTPRDDGAAKNAYFSGSQNVGIGATNGTASPAQRLTVLTGNVVATQQPPTAPAVPPPESKVKSPRICNTSSSNCFKPDDIAADAGPSAPLYCPLNVGLKGVGYAPATQSANKTCYTFPVRTTPLATCPLGIKGFQPNGDPICAN